ncbi:hypothetical protein [Nocardia sp. NPDC005825]|uniref:hypothetical protein n=1 Tax=unclassified Nocardia TaxID=2637762 RepID=UPI0033D08577
MSQQIRTIVEVAWREHIGLPTEWTSSQIESFLATATATISSEIDRRIVASQPRALNQWREQMGQEPDYLTTVGLISKNGTLPAAGAEAAGTRIPVGCRGVDACYGGNRARSHQGTSWLGPDDRRTLWAPPDRCG